MTEVKNGRWWRVPSFSVENIVTYVMVMVPVAAFCVAFYVEFKDMKRDVGSISRKMPQMATKPWVRNIVNQGNESFDAIDERVDQLEGRTHKLYMPVQPYEEEGVR